MSTYEEGVARLIEQARRKDDGWSPTPVRNDLLNIRKQILELVELLNGQTVALTYLEVEHELDPPPIFGEDGWPVDQPKYGAGFNLFPAVDSP